MDLHDSSVGVGPHPKPWPEDPRLDPDLLAQGDRRNVVDEFRYWKLQEIVTELDTRRHSFHVAIENLQHDFNIGSVVRTANAFLACEVHIVGRKRWNRRGAMVTDRYQHIRHHADAAQFQSWANSENLLVLGFDNVEGSLPLESYEMPKNSVLLFGQEGTGLSAEARDVCDALIAISQFGSTRSINVGAAAAIAMHTWIRQHAVTSVAQGGSATGSSQ
ncbi:MAG: RNA methyltransferase [Actinomycetota bacterium]|nr:RNA methyltransferase [Actinomycetota bacterium]